MGAREPRRESAASPAPRLVRRSLTLSALRCCRRPRPILWIRVPRRTRRRSRRGLASVPSRRAANARNGPVILVAASAPPRSISTDPGYVSDASGCARRRSTSETAGSQLISASDVATISATRRARRNRMLLIDTTPQETPSSVQTSLVLDHAARRSTLPSSDDSESDLRCTLSAARSAYRSLRWRSCRASARSCAPPPS